MEQTVAHGYLCYTTCNLGWRAVAYTYIIRHGPCCDLCCVSVLGRKSLTSLTQSPAESAGGTAGTGQGTAGLVRHRKVQKGTDREHELR